MVKRCFYLKMFLTQNTIYYRNYQPKDLDLGRPNKWPQNQKLLSKE